jgi:hypothetical protein
MHDTVEMVSLLGRLDHSGPWWILNNTNQPQQRGLRLEEEDMTTHINNNKTYPTRSSFLWQGNDFWARHFRFWAIPEAVFVAENR